MPIASPTPAEAPRLRLALITSALPLGGAEQHQLSVLSGLGGFGFESQVLCLREPGVSAARFRAAGIPVTVAGRRGWQHLATLPWLVAWLRRERIDVVLATTHMPSLYFTLVAARLARVRGTALGLHQTGGKALGIPSLPWHSVEFLWLLDALILLSPAQRSYIAREEGFASRPWRKTTTALIPNGAHVRPVADASTRLRVRAELGIHGDAPLIACVAALRPEKDHPTLLRAFAQIGSAHPSARLVLVGNGTCEEDLRTEAKRLKIADRVIFAGFRDDVAALLSGVDIFCLTSVQETYPVSVLEAMAAARPVVMTRCDGVPELVAEGETGWTIPIADDAALAARLDQLLADPRRAQAMGVAGRRRVSESFSFETTLARHAALFRALAQAPGDAGLIARRVPPPT